MCSSLEKMPQCNTCKQFFKNIYNHISQGLCHQVLASKHVDRGVQDHSPLERCSEKEAFLGSDINDICDHPSKRSRISTTTSSNARNGMDTTDELVNREFEHCNDFDDEVSIQTSNTDLNNRLEHWQQRNDDTESLYDLDRISDTEDEMDSSACHIALANNNDDNNNNMYQVWGNVHQVLEKVCEHISQEEDHLLIRLTALCCNANVPLYLANEIVDIFVMKQNVVWF